MAEDCEGHTFPIRSTIREAKEHIHRKFVVAQWVLDIQAMEAQRTFLKKYCKKEEFIARCVDHNANRVQTWRELDLDLSDSETEITGIDDDHLTAHLAIIFKQVPLIMLANYI